MKKLIFTGLLLALSACGPVEDLLDRCEPPPDELEQIGQPSKYADWIIETAKMFPPCDGVDWRIQIEWVPDYFDCGGVYASGCYSRMADHPECVRRITVKYFPSAFNGALAHELGHHVLKECGRDYDEFEADFWGSTLETLTRQRMLDAGVTWY
jgi:hypothetical protein